MDQYPCVICSSECKTDALQCTNCRQWVHSDCIPMSAKDLRSWSRDYLEFLCTTCSFNGDVYDAGQALQRLQKAFHLKEKIALTNAAKSESKLLITYGIFIPESEHMSTNGEKDAVSVEILKMYNPAILWELVPMSVCGDGNCLYRAVSRALTGSENFHELLRLRTAIELILNPIYYDEKSNNFFDLICDNRIVVSDYSKLVKDAIEAGSYSEMAHIYALSASISQPIRSYYPLQLQAEFASEPFNRKVVGRSVNKSASPVACIMWIQMSVPERTNGFIPNHFVPLLYENKEHMVIVNVDESVDDSLDDSVDVISVNSDMTAKHVSNEYHTDIIDDVTEIHNEVKDGNDTYKHPAKGKLDQDCKEIFYGGETKNGVYKISPDGRCPFEVFCDMTNGGWTLIQKRQDGSVNFNRGWDNYVSGFGKQDGEHWLGLEKIPRLTQGGSQIHFTLELYNRKIKHAHYKAFTVDDVTTVYKMNVDPYEYEGSLPELFHYHNNMRFATFNRDTNACALQLGGGGWWYSSCYRLANVNGVYGTQGTVGISYWNKERIDVKNTTVKLQRREYSCN